MGGVLAAIVLGVAVFAILRARSVVEDTWDLRPARSPTAIVAAAVAVVVVLIVAPGLLAVIAGAALVAAALYAGWRLRRV
jgi:hypothetical protein